MATEPVPGGADPASTPPVVDAPQEVAAWEEDRNERMVGVKWRFATTDARVKLRSLYPSINE